MHPAPLVLGALLLLPLYGLLVFVAATRLKDSLCVQLPYLIGIVFFAVSIAVYRDFWVPTIGFVVYCGLTSLLVHFLKKFEH